ncbi:CPBP family intramembrane glutamic endopeptidase [Pseudomonas viridiflava]|uniref:CPBP family intramembrane glutamic endopeptidase n=1 Tax=Pseudomonas viridiflava TaxID=33069 RepID=UPI000F022AAC|nr:type II CAAX endopeptidase family protein [Pseudomonas viridiflava]MBI6702234.1 CPBP family intramembrane metalloprotease [Pseudomonas viridiflava]MBI6724504.1 CPBP family intramembrane metalloprotease [Pseudomonas viridiflava]MEE4080066.1 type II CAAX endopeptidase family protein [Pseudomonas viridiflava]MEE4097471.1 type II CAAX endopeptidase family protein [Pseudomonas viridiflava]MEE4232270.1 type II CAAX endopeptidase family protein [Pseudomonas viridiflava]
MTSKHWPVLALLSTGYGLALSLGSLSPAAALGFGLLIVAGFCVVPSRTQYLRAFGHGLFILTAVALALHVLPGFNNAKVIDAARFSPDAAPFTLYLNLDKPLVGFWLLLACPWILSAVAFIHSLKVGVLALVVTSAFCMTAAVVLGVIGWAPKWPAQSTVWWVNNLLLVTVTEELFFRAYLQNGLQNWFGHAKFATPLAIAITASLFGLSHFGAGWEWVLLAAIAGVGYGVAFRFGGLPAAVISHFGLNLVHFGLFTYPMAIR